MVGQQLNTIAPSAVLKLEPGDQDALGCKLVALIQAGQFDAALQLINSKALQADVGFEKVWRLLNRKVPSQRIALVVLC